MRQPKHNSQSHHHNPTQDSVSYLTIMLSRKMLICLFTGFASGLPFYLSLQLLPVWFINEGVNIKTIGVFALAQFPYVWKFLWSPIMDNLSLFGLGRRRGWMLLSQVILLFAIISLGQLSPTQHIMLIAAISLTISFFSATQDVALDAFRREILSEEEFGLGNSIHINAYRVAGLVPGTLSLILSHYLPWSMVFLITGLFMLPAIAMTLLVKEPVVTQLKKRRFKDIFFDPITDFLHRSGWRSALLILAFIFLYKLGDSMSVSMATVFYAKMGFSNMDIGLVAKNASLWPSVIGGLLGGVLMLKIGLNRALWIFGFVQVISIFGFVWLSMLGPFTTVGPYQLVALAVVISLESLGAGLGTAAFVTYIAKNTNPLYTATQFALFSSIASIPRTFFNASAGYLQSWLGWTDFFWLCVLLSIPGMVLLVKVAPWSSKT